MSNLSRWLFLGIATVLSFNASVAASPPPAAIKFNGATPLEWSQRLADAEMKRLGGSLERGQGKARWDYAPGCWRSPWSGSVKSPATKLIFNLGRGRLLRMSRRME